MTLLVIYSLHETDLEFFFNHNVEILNIKEKVWEKKKEIFKLFKSHHLNDSLSNYIHIFKLNFSPETRHF